MCQISRTCERFNAIEKLKLEIEPSLVHTPSVMANYLQDGETTRTELTSSARLDSTPVAATRLPT
jgi:hypothetical protein